MLRSKLRDAGGRQAKIVVCGAAGCGKSALLHRYTTGEFVAGHKQTLGADLVRREGEGVTVNIWCCSGQPRYRPILYNHFIDAQGFLLVYDITSAESYKEVEFWYNEVQRLAAGAPCVLVGAKMDMSDSGKVSRDEADKLAQEWGMPHIVCSAKTGKGAGRPFEEVMGAIARRWAIPGITAAPTPAPARRPSASTPARPVSSAR
eukprot:tig00020553_g10551.t1